MLPPFEGHKIPEKRELISECSNFYKWKKANKTEEMKAKTEQDKTEMKEEINMKNQVTQNLNLLKL